MLIELSVRDFGIIEEMRWRLGQGFNVVTGETGAGKSLVVDAVEMLLTGRGDRDMVRHGADEAQLEGVFRIIPGTTPDLVKLLTDNGLLAEDGVVISCTIGRQGRSLVRVNDRTVTKGLLRQIGELLVDVHGQSEHLSLLNKKFHLDFLDAYARTLVLRHRFSEAAAALVRMTEELKSLTAAEKESARQEEFLRFQIDEIERANLKEGEEEALERERNILASGAQLKELSFAAYQALSGEELAGASTRDRLHEAGQLLRKLVELDPAQKQQLDFVEGTLYGLEEAARSLRSYHDRLEDDPARLEEVEARRELIRSLKRKYGPTVADVQSFLERAQKELDSISHASERKGELEELCRRQKKELGTLAAQISRQRSGAALKLVQDVRQELNDLNMAQVDFAVAITRLPDEDGIPLPDGKTYACTPDGVDIVEFRAATNPGEPQKPLAQIASAGEISRFMLALKGALSEADNIPVLIFDEIDVGVGGRSGEIIGKKLWALARQRQVICVTHLPQIAVFADAHFAVHKEVAGARTSSMLRALHDDARLEELALMLSGPGYTETSLKNATEILQKAAAWKKTVAGKQS